MIWVYIIVSQVVAYVVGDAIVNPNSAPPQQQVEQYHYDNFKITSECHRDEKHRLICPKTAV